MIESLDVRTLILILTLGHAIAALLLFFSTLKRAQIYDTVFMISMALQAAGWMLLFFRGTISDILSFSLGNTLIFCGFCLENIALLSLVRTVNKHWLQYFAAILALSIFIIWLPLTGQNQNVGIVSFVIPLFFLFPGVFLVFSSPRPTPLQQFTGSILLFYSTAVIIRGISLLVAKDYSLLTPTFFQILFLSGQFVIMALASTGYILIRREIVSSDLEDEISDRQVIEEEVRRKSDLLKEWVKELNCLYEVSRLIETTPRDKDLFSALVNEIPAGWRYPDLTCARITINSREYPSKGFQTSGIKQESVLTMYGKTVGSIEVFFLGDPTIYGTEPFLPEESSLIIALGERISRMMERHWSEVTLRESEERFRRLLSRSFDAVVIHQDGRIVMANDSAVRIVGASNPDDLIGKQIIDLVHPDYRLAVAERVQEMLASKEGTVPLMEEKFLRLDGTPIPVAVMATATQHEGRPAVIVVFRDITRQKEAEKALETANQFSDTIIDSIPGIFYVLDEQGHFVRRNPHHQIITGYSDEELHNITALDTIAPDDRDLVAGIIQKVFREQGFTTTTVNILTKDGRKIPYLLGGLTMTLAGKKYLVGTGIDITKQVQAQEALRESEEKFRTMFENIQDFVYRADMDGNFTMVNPAGVRMLGYESMDQMIGLPVTDVYANPEDRKTFLDALSQNGSVSGYPIIFKSRKGTNLHVIASSHLYYDENGVPIGVEGVLHDLTDLHRAEEGLRMANHKLNLLSSITRHDIMNQLQALHGYIHLSTDSLEKPETLADYLAKEEIIALNIQRQIEFTKDYEDLGVKSPVWQDVSKLLHNVSLALQLQDIRLLIECPGIEIFADPLLYKVFYNLTDNALHYGGGKMTSIRLFAYPQSEDLILIFEDDGEGISFEDKQKLFTRGFGKHTGLGLFLSREILAITGITIIENGKPGNGARFEITVPNGKWRALQ
ncbi:PAS domain S-box protein [Methanospirillum stamsii]|uniref:histidine kinase n=1 Tax=Methanospirillum stamsii TaxID=1277351 RepID=A0A2V2MWT0_9EURY|nr:PAS domain S-box protein [Methanospirillum stamsii]PWR72362.1 hypothetical protein DLD82_12285 [Methanospirillum stamsii]